MKTYEQLMKHYWGVIVPMAEAAGVNPWECVRDHEGDVFGDHPCFNMNPDCYTFALTVHEKTPLFYGDKVYGKSSISDTRGVLVQDVHPDCWSALTVTPPTKKRTFEINGVEYNSPIDDSSGCRLDFLGVDYYFETMRDRNDVAIAINNMLFTARDKE